MNIKYLRTATSLVSLIFLSWFGSGALTGHQTPSENTSMRQLLVDMKAEHLSTEQLATLLRIGDERIGELIKALDDPDKQVQTNAQIVIRYLGNDEGLNAWIKNYLKHKGTVFTGPIPLPIHEWDYEFIRSQYLQDNITTEPILDAYLFALALDGSPRAVTLFNQVIANARRHGFLIDESRYLKVAQVDKIVAGDNLAESVLVKASFLNSVERVHATAKLIGYNGATDKALVEIYVNGGLLAKEWYHIVISKWGRDWKFFSVTQVAVS